MKAIIFGASGMVGQAVLRECVLDPGIEKILTIVRTPSVSLAPKQTDLVHKDFLDFSTVAKELTGYDACFWCLGVTSAGMSEADYMRVTHDYTLAAAQELLKLNPNISFIFVSGAGSDSSEKERTMWARVKGKTENAILRMPFKSSFVFRPGFIEPRFGVMSRTASYRFFYKVLKPIVPILRIFPRIATTSDHLGKAMIKVARGGAPKRVLESADFNAL